MVSSTGSAVHSGGYTARDVARLLGMSVGQVRGYVRGGFLAPGIGRRGEYRFSLQDVILLRTARDLADRVPPRKVRRALEKLREQLPSSRPLSGVRITASGDSIVVRDGSEAWEPESGQVLLKFEVAELAEQVAPLARKAAADAWSTAGEHDAEDWYNLGCDLESAAQLGEARDAYARALELAPGHAGARVNLGRLLHEQGRTSAAEEQYRQALETCPGDATAAFNLGVVLDDQGRVDEAIAAYRLALEADAELVDAHYNLARLLERIGERAAAFGHLKSYKQLVERP